MSEAPKKSLNPLFDGRPINVAPAANQPDPNVLVIRVQHALRRDEERWTLLENWFPSPALVWRERCPRWQVPGVVLATIRELREWA